MSEFVLVPKEPTREMLHAATMQVPTWDDEASKRKYAAMLSAKPAHLDEMMKAYEDLEEAVELVTEGHLRHSFDANLKACPCPLCAPLSRLRALKEGR